MIVSRNVSEAVGLVQDLQCLLNRGGFNIAKGISYNREVMRSIPTSDMAVGIKNLDLDPDTQPGIIDYWVTRKSFNLISEFVSLHIN